MIKRHNIFTLLIGLALLLALPNMLRLPTHTNPTQATQPGCLPQLPWCYL